MHAIRRTLTALLTSQLIGTLALAGPITFDLTRVAPNPSQDNVAAAFFAQQGVYLSVTSDFHGVNIDWDQDGLGLQLNSLESDELESRGRDESLFFTFDTRLALLGATFSRIDDDDGFRVIGGGQVFQADLHSGSAFTFASPALVDETFQFTTADRSDDYKITSITVARVPAPGTLLLLAMGIPVIHVVRRRLLTPA